MCYAKYVGITNGKLRLCISSNNTTWNVAETSGTKAIQKEIWYWIKLKFDGNLYQVLISEDGINYEKDIEVVTTTISYQADKYVFGANLFYLEKFYGFFDLKVTYIKIGDRYFFNGLDYFSYQ